MQNFVDTMDNLPWIAKIILAIPVLDIVWNIYRIVKSCIKNNVLGIVLGILLIVPGTTIMWIVDIIFLICYKKVLWID